MTADITDRARDGKYWCSEGCGFVDSGHRCEQWCNLTFIPSAALQRERDEAGGIDPDAYRAANVRAEKAEGEAKALLTDNRELAAQNDAYQSQNTQLRREANARKRVEDMDRYLEEDRHNACAQDAHRDEMEEALNHED
jgi:hypothetical protein